MGHAKAQAVNFQPPLKTETSIQTQGNQCVICAWQRVLSDCCRFFLSQSLHQCFVLIFHSSPIINSLSSSCHIQSSFHIFLPVVMTTETRNFCVWWITSFNTHKILSSVSLMTQTVYAIITSNHSSTHSAVQMHPAPPFPLPTTSLPIVS
jgi:hypothetical protein